MIRPPSASAFARCFRPLGLLALLAGTIAGFTLPAAGATIYSDNADGAVYRLFANGSVGNFPNQPLIVGKTDNASYNGIAFFLLPDLQGGTLSTAALTFTVQTSGTLDFANIDLWALGYVRTAALTSSWVSTSNTETRTGATLGTNIGTATPTKIVDNWITSGTTPAAGTVYQTDTAQSAILLTFLTSLYDSYGAVAGDYAVFRLNPDAEITDTTLQNIRFGSSVNPTPDRRSALTVTVIPEPTVGLLAGFGALGLLARRRRSRE